MKSFQEFREHYGIDDDQVAVEEYRRYKQQLEIFGNIEESKKCEIERWKRIRFTQTKKLPQM